MPRLPINRRAFSDDVNHFIAPGASDIAEGVRINELLLGGYLVLDRHGNERITPKGMRVLFAYAPRHMRKSQCKQGV